jgi:2-C-methyl-D-erythritol 2,4-cyclodiphosphate synthase
MNRVGIGYDIHCFAAGRRLILGGVEIPFSKGLDGHSDADVLCHAIADAILGAAGEADIGHHFPNTDPTIEGISSLVLLRKVRAIVEQAGGTLINVDATLLAEHPKISPHLAEMRSRIGEAIGLPVTRIGIKATTNEKLGSIGRGEGIAAMAVASVSFAD